MAQPFKLGKLPAKKDPRNLLMSDILVAKKAPEEFDFDSTHQGIPLPMFGNDKHGRKLSR
jgi:hypothetical protein